ncbi:MAG: ABC transporter permease [Acetobacteraceae bacterium]|nr:ABC transporter permease [Acetobacteraceae bacterium]
MKSLAKTSSTDFRGGNFFLKTLYSLFDIGTNASVCKRFAVRLWDRRSLLFEMTRREITDRYAGQWFGWTWAALHPLAVVCIFIFLFTTVFNTRFPQNSNLPRDYSTYLLSGLIPWLSMQAALSASATALTSAPNLVKQALFPIEVLPARHVLASLLPLAVGLAVLLLYMMMADGALPISVVLLPVAVALHLVFILGVSLALSCLGAFMRDVKDLIQVYLQIGTYIIPIVYLPGWVPDTLRPIVMANPFGFFVTVYQDVLFYGSIVNPLYWLLAFLAAGASFLLGLRLFAKLQPYVADVV